MAQSRIGKVAAATTATAMIHQYPIKIMIVTGVAGGVSTHTKIGDICIASSSVQHDMDARGLFPQFEIPLLAKTFFETNPNLIELATRSAQDFLNHDFTTDISTSSTNTFDLHRVSIHKGLLASGDQFIGSKSKLAELQNYFPDLLFVEMEGAAVAQVGFEYGLDVVNIRVISDNANDEAHLDSMHLSIKLPNIIP